MSSDPITLYKLMILYMLDSVTFPLTTAQVSDFLLGRDYTNYFSLQTSLSELSETELITIESSRNISLCRISDTGKETIEYFRHKIPYAIQADIKEYLQKNKYSLREEVSTLSDFSLLPSKEFMVNCKVLEHDTPILEINLSVPTALQAESICKNWRANSQEIYAYLMKNLLK